MIGILRISFRVATKKGKHFNFWCLIFRTFYYNLKWKNSQLYDNRGAFPFSVVLMSHLESNISSNIYYLYLGSEILRFGRTASDIYTFVTLSNRLLKRMHKQGIEHRSIIPVLNKIFCRHFTVFNVFADTAANHIKLFSMSWTRTIHIEVSLLHRLLLLFSFCSFVFL